VVRQQQEGEKANIRGLSWTSILPRHSSSHLRPGDCRRIGELASNRPAIFRAFETRQAYPW
jgi:hypothetical protein